LARSAVEQGLTRAGTGSAHSDGGLAMNLKKIVGFLVVIFVLFWIISQPGNASSSVNSILANLKSAGTSIATFMTNVV
jgi:hypothetical protein